MTTPIRNTLFYLILIQGGNYTVPLLISRTRVMYSVQESSGCWPIVRLSRNTWCC